MKIRKQQEIILGILDPGVESDLEAFGIGKPGKSATIRRRGLLQVKHKQREIRN
jgi:hypothetical protein